MTHFHLTRRALACLALTALLGGCGWNEGAGKAPPATVPAPAPATYTVGGSISGLSAAGLVLANGVDSVNVAAMATGFTLPTAVAQGGAYAVTVRTQPSGEQCSLTNSSGNINGANVTNVAVTCAAIAHSLGGTISGLASSGLVLANGSDTLSPAPGALSFSFATPVAEGGAYAVAVQTQPSGETCSVGSGSGTMGTSDINAVQVTCSANAYHLGGTISGLTAGGLILANGTNTVSPAANATSFTFTQTVAFGGNYSVTVKQQPTGLTCSVAGNFPATMGAGDVTNVAVTCAGTTALLLLAGRETCPANGPTDIDGTGAAASIYVMSGMAFDAAGNFYVTESHGTVRKVTPAGVVTTLAGQFNVAPVNPVDGTGSAALFGSPKGIAADSAGNLYVVDGYEIREVTQAGVVTTLAGSLFSGNVDGTGTAARFASPYGVAVDTASNIFVADTLNNKIRKVTAGGVVTTFAGSGLQGSADGTGNGASFYSPRGIAIDASNNLFVTDGSGSGLIRKITPAGVVTTLAGAAGSVADVDGTGSAARFWLPNNISIDSAGNLFVSDSDQTAIRKVTPAGVVTTVAITQAFSTYTGLPVPAGAMQLPVSGPEFAYAVNGAGSLYLQVGCAVEKTGP